MRILTNGRLFDVERARFEDGRAIVIEDGRISDVIARGEVPAEGDHELVDLGGAHVLPGLIDTHYHLMSRSGAVVDDALITRGTIDATITARRAIEAGLTSVRDPGCRHRGLYTFRDEIDAGRVLGPRAFVAGPNLVGTGAPVDWRNRFVDGTQEVIHAVRDEVRAGADMIKLVLSHTSSSSGWTQCLRFLNDEEIGAAIREAHLLHVPVGCHCEGISAATAVIEAGVDVIDHGLNLNEDLVRRMADQGTFYAPTLWAFATETQAEVGGTISAASRSQYDERIARPHREAVQMAMAAGVRITVGSDPVHWIPARDVFICELEALVDAGMSPQDALVAGTKVGAECIERGHDLGRIARGTVADLVVVDGSPLERLRALERVLMVIKEGEVMVDVRNDQDRAEALWREMASGAPASPRQPELWMERR